MANNRLDVSDKTAISIERWTLKAKEKWNRNK